MKRTSRLRLVRVAMVTVVALLGAVLVPSLGSAPSASAATDGRMVYPASGNIQSKVGDGCRSNYRAHDGIDISGQGGTPILAAYDGIVRTRAFGSGYGNYVDIEHPGGYVTRYAHMAAPGTVAPGARVVRGQQIGVVGKTGATTALHLHFEVWRNGAVYTRINDGFTCLSNVARGTAIPLTFPGLGALPYAAVLSADYTGNRKADLLGIAADSDLHHFGGTGTGRFGSASIITSAWGTRKHLTHTDFNGDGVGDILVARNDGVLEFYAGRAGGGFGGLSTAGTGWYTMLLVTSGADYTGDGRQDVLGVSPAGMLSIYRGNGAGGFTAPTVTVGGGWQEFRHLVGGDFDDDGIGDLMAVDSAGTLFFYPGVVNKFGARRSLGGGWGAFTALTGGVDYNGDGFVDLIARTAAGELYLYPGTGSGTLGARTLIGTGWSGYLELE
ncbi:VCBS repeat domain-containing M23 family metallopeptidase [Microbacterium sp. SSW1-49]|uniref:VCBS repeat domain-containing M23 family metallopeptidase n=1 Tax=Microbacterium croceum TaxID=2851645 RepID=A0ABT0FC30_9MICO|nr:VCBS repeat domain-containing M23 family metallopeptidase [Microbacterium croceum]MCK2035604.1 VCBS repeat domain-containing M23 family metallopeptidase [Microbacterium croceum]